MSDFNCAACGAARVGPGTACLACHVSPEWQDLFHAGRVAGDECLALHQQGLLSEVAIQWINEILSAMRLQWAEQARHSPHPPAEMKLCRPLRCRQCDRPAGAAQKFCATCGGPTGARADRLRYLDFTVHLFTDSLAAIIEPGTAERCIEALRARIFLIEIDLKSGSETQASASPARPSGRRGLVEILLDPQSIRWLLASGGVLLTVGLVIFLSSLGVFKNVMVVASTMGAGTLATLVAGIAVIRFTRHSLAGRAMALLGCLVMPLNLWFYNANGLVTLDGHLWAVAMVCCVLYAAAAFVMKDPLFVYVLFGGISMTGLLALADLHRLVEISAPAALLVSLGLVSLHAERAFADDDGPFSRKRFGMACVWSAHAMLGLGLLLLLGSQIAACMPGFGFGLNQFAALPSNRFLALALVLAGTYAYTYSSLVVRRSGVYGYAALFCLLWAELLGIRLGNLTHHLPVLVSAMTLTSLAMNVGVAVLRRKATDAHDSLASPLPPLAIGLSALAVVLGLLPQLRAFLPNVTETLDLTTTWGYVAAMALLAASSHFVAAIHGKARPRLGMAYHGAAVTATFLTAASSLALLGLTTGPASATILMALPLVYLIVARFVQDGPAKRALPLLAGVGALVLMLATLVSDNLHWINPIAGQPTDLWLAAFAFEAAVFFGISAATQRVRHNVFLAAAMVCAMLYQLVGFCALPLQAYNVALALAGVAGLAGHRFLSTGVREKNDKPSALFLCANALVALPMTGVMLLSMSRVALGSVDLSTLWTPAILGGIALMAALFSAGGVRRCYVAMTISQIGLSLLSLAQYSTLTLPRKMELFSVAAGLVLLVVGYVAWYRKQDSESDGVGFCLLFGALLAGLPPAVFAVINRFGFDVSLGDELTLVTIAVLMFLSGMMSRVRATTLIGGGLLACHLLTLIVFAGMKTQLALGAYVAIGGAALFAVGLVLSIYRDRLLTMPQRIKHREGLFRVLAWR